MDGRPISSLTKKVNSVHDKEEIEPTHSNDNSDESSAKSAADEENAKFEGTKLKPSTSLEGHEAKCNPLIESIGEILEAKTNRMVTQIKLNIATSVKDLKLNSAT